MSDKKLVLVDGSSYLYRAYHALPKLTSSRGEATGAIHGVLNMINKLVAEETTEHFVVIFDAPGKTFRDELFSEYKANRPPMPDDLREQVDPLLKAIPAMGLPLLRVDGVEADDVIGTLCHLAEAAGMQVLVSTGDKDMAQLVNANVTLVNTMTGSRLDREGVKKKFDVFPEQIIDYLALVGDSSDNIPGVPKVGAKTAAKWLNLYPTAEEIIANADEFAGKVGESLRENIDQLKMSQTLATIRLDVELPNGPAELKRAAADVETLREFFSRYEMKRMLSQLDDNSTAGEEVTPAEPTPKGNYETVLTEKDFSRWQKKINAADLTAFDTETTSINYMEAELVGISLAVETGEAAYIPVAHDYPGAPDQLNRDFVLNAMKDFLEDPEKPKVGHHLKYDAHILARYDIQLRGMAFDSMLESYVLNSVATRHDMDSVARHYLNVDTIHYADVAGKGVKQLTFNQVDLEQAAPYAAEDADITLKLHNKIWGELKKTPSLRTVYEDIEQPLVPVLLKMEECGVLLDRGMLKKQSGELAITMMTLEKEAHELAGGPFNLGSPKQLQEILFGQLGLPVIRKTPKGQPSTAEDVLQELAGDFDLPRVILQYRSVSKLKSTYTDKLPLQVAEHTGRIHTSYHQAVAATGRLSSTDPNLQNIPIRTPEGRRIRQAFIPPEGKILLAADYSQIELRIMAHLSGDEGLVKAFTEDLDVHSATAAEVFGLDVDKVTVDQRRSAKAINFGLMYGMSAFGLAKQLGIGRGQAQEYVELYFDRYPGVRKFMDDIREQARQTGFVETEFGRRLYLPEINDRNAQRRQYAERSAINAPMQGTAADIIKRAMITVHNWLSDDKVPARMIMQVHDELVLEVDEKSVDSVRAEVVKLMSAAADLSVPLKVDAGVGLNWDEAH
ncbi:MAG: DNA polymerase I [Woeseia sp.]|jgi:DNA polymerase I|nr:DNA polymerase I [Woeseia sp.]MBT6210291.1 DNA polymerase I [Woeseia sp.]